MGERALCALIVGGAGCGLWLVIEQLLEVFA